MKLFIFALFLSLSSAVCRADTFLLKDGTKLEGEVTGEMDGTTLIKTRYGSLTLNNSDIVERQAAPETAAPQPAETPAALPPPDQAMTPAALTFATLLPDAATRLLVYSENGVAIATETFDAAGALVSLEGAVKNGTYTESYPDGSLKTVKTILGGKMSGSLKAYYQSGVLQVEAYYFDGAKEGEFRYFGENGKPLMEAAYKNNKLNGWKKEYGPDGALKSEAFYQDDRAVDPPKPAAEAAKPQEQESLVTGKTLRVARGEILSFSLNGKYIGKLRLDRDYNVTGQEGKTPDGAVRIYGKDGKLQKEMIFKQKELKILRLYEEGGQLKATYTFREGKASKFAQP